LLVQRYTGVHERKVGDGFDWTSSAISVLDMTSLEETPLLDRWLDAAGLGWSPDGTTVTFTEDGTVYAMPATGGAPRALLNGALGPISWSPDGERFVFTKAMAHGSGIAIASADGSHVSPLPIARSTSCGTSISGRTICGGPRDPAWSPDGAWIAYVNVRVNAHGFPKGSEIDAIGADGIGLHQLADSNASELVWSPDGSTLAYTRGMGHGVFAVGADGSGWRQEVGDGSRIRWSPDGSTISYVCPDGICLHDLATVESPTLPRSDRSSAHLWANVAWRPTA
jgi:Tol biopolymer transport system component